MKRWIVLLLSLLLVAVVRAQESRPAQSQPSEVSPSFRFVDVYVDSGAARLAAYQVEWNAADVQLVGVEGGDAAAFKSPPYYDPRALSQSRVIVAAFNIGADLPAGKTRVARLMVRVDGAAVHPDYRARVAVAASADGSPITATVSLSEGVAP